MQVHAEEVSYERDFGGAAPEGFYRCTECIVRVVAEVDRVAHEKCPSHLRNAPGIQPTVGADAVDVGADSGGDGAHDGDGGDRYDGGDFDAGDSNGGADVGADSGGDGLRDGDYGDRYDGGDFDGGDSNGGAEQRGSDCPARDELESIITWELGGRIVNRELLLPSERGALDEWKHWTIARQDSTTSRAKLWIKSMTRCAATSRRRFAPPPRPRRRKWLKRQRVRPNARKRNRRLVVTALLAIPPRRRLARALNRRGSCESSKARKCKSAGTCSQCGYLLGNRRQPTSLVNGELNSFSCTGLKSLFYAKRSWFVGRNAM